jgi:hypothetical protein
VKQTKDVQLKNHTYNVECDDCGVTYKKNITKTQSKGAKRSMCVNHLQEANAMCKVKIGGITMRCRSKKYTQRRGDKDVVSKFCGKGNKCKNLSQNKE